MPCIPAGVGVPCLMAGSTRVLVLTDVAGSTRLWAEHPAVMLAVMRRHHRIVHDAIEAHDGLRPTDQGEGDAVFAAFTSAPQPSRRCCVPACARGGAVAGRHRAPGRVGIHAGEVTEQDGNLFGARSPDGAHPFPGCGRAGPRLGTRARARRGSPPVRHRRHGSRDARLRDLERPEAIHQLVGPGMGRRSRRSTVSVEARGRPPGAAFVVHRSGAGGGASCPSAPDRPAW